MVGIADVIVQFKASGIFDFYLPFIILFAILYTVLTRTKIFGSVDDPKTGKGARRINLIVSLAASFFIMGYTPAGISLAQFFGNFFGQTFVVLLTLIGVAMMGYIFVTILPIKEEQKQAWKLSTRVATIVIILFLLIGVAIFFSSGGAAFFPGLTFGSLPSSPIVIPSLSWPQLGVNLSSTDLAIIFLVIVTGLIIWAVGKPDKANPNQSRTS